MYNNRIAADLQATNSQ